MRVVTSLRDPLIFPLPSKLCPQRVLAVSNLVAVPALPEHDEAIVAVVALPIRLPVSVPVKSLLKEASPFTINLLTVVVPPILVFPDKAKLGTLSVLVEV